MKNIIAAVLLVLAANSQAQTDIQAQRAAWLAQGQVVYTSQCQACHGAQATGGFGPSLVELTGDQIMDRLIQYRSGETLGERSSIMRAQVATLTENDMFVVAAYISRVLAK